MNMRMPGLITYIKGDATAPKAIGNKFIAHICNDLGAWGKGFVLAVSSRWSEPEKQYREWHRDRTNNDFELGAIQLVQVESDIWIANMIGQHGIKRSSKGPPIRYDALDKSLSQLASEAVELKASVHMPRIGCGLAGGKWECVEPLIEKQLSSRGIAVYVYDFG
jgi:O-acetyl-ADP-ribose deacetylase (regulator of RNase III)